MSQNGESEKILSNDQSSLDEFSDDKICDMIKTNRIKLYQLENFLSDTSRAVAVRRYYLKHYYNVKLDDLDYKYYDYSKLINRNCENVVGFVRVPIGLVGPVVVNAHAYWVPFATTEGCLVASANRGGRCLAACGVRGFVIDDAMTRAPALKVDSISTAVLIKKWLAEPPNFNRIKAVFDATSRFLRLIDIIPVISGRFVYLRFRANTAEAMGMNMVSKGANEAVGVILAAFRGRVELISVSSNLCTDKKSSALNWVSGRGKSVVCEAFIPAQIIESRLHVNPANLVSLNISKNLVGSATAAAIGGNNANAANVVAAVFLATGQDVAQVVESSQCLTFLEMQNDLLYISCTMPCLEVGVVGGGTHLPSQNSCLKMMELDRDTQYSRSANLALVICAAVLCSELSLLAAQATDTLVSSHMKFNRSTSEKSDLI